MTGGPAPVVVLTYAHSGAERLRAVLGGWPEVACTSGTGLLPLCEQAAATWRHAEGRAGTGLSALASASVRALAGGVITTILAGSGARVWCEIATAPPRYAETFLGLYPGTRFLCLHRGCADVIAAGVRANPWRIAAGEVLPFAGAFPGNQAAALASYWAHCTGQLLEFERAHAEMCLRVKVEDVDFASEKIGSFLDLGERTWPGSGGAEPMAAGAQVPGDCLPPSLLAQVADLLEQLGYPPMP